MYVLQENKLSDIEKSIPNDAQVHCLIGKGKGNQYYSKCDPSYLGIWTQEIYEVEDGYKDASGILKSHTDAEYARRAQDYQWKVSTYEKMQLASGDSMELRPNKEPIEVLSIAEYTIELDGKKSISLGASRPKFIDSWNVIQDFSGGYTDKYIKTARAAITQTADFTPPATADLTFKVPVGALLATIRPRITLSLDISLANGTSWVTGILYHVTDRVTHTGAEYVCISEHTSSIAGAVGNEPGIGNTWATKWSSDPLLVGRVATRIMIGTDYVRFGQFPPNTIGGIGYPEIDVTDDVVEGDNIFKISLVAVTGTLPLLTASATMNFYKRSEIK